jgi:DNA-binding HxlR family transcriptional regulator
MAAEGVNRALHLLGGRWKMAIVFQMFAYGTRRFSELERSIPAISQKMLAQHLRELERDGLVIRTVYPEIPPKVEYRLTDWGQRLCPVLDALLDWAVDAPSANASTPF